MGATPKSLCFDGSSEASALPVRTVQGADAEAQQAARDAVMQIRLFPELPAALRKAIGYGPHADMLQHLVFWFHPRHPSMQKRWTLWKTFAEWHDECGLTDRQVKKGRKILDEKGLATYKRGQYSRVYYRVDWVALAQVLGIDFIPDGNSVQYDDFDIWFDDDEDDSIPDGNSVRLHSGRYSDQVIPDGNSVRLNTGDHAGNYSQETTLLQRDGEPAFAEPPSMNGNGKKEEKEAPPLDEKRHSQNGHTPSESRLERRETPTLSAYMKIKVHALVSGRAEEQVVRRFADNHIWNRNDSFGEPFTLERVAQKAREVLQGEEPLEAYVPFVERCMEDRLEEMADAEKAVFEAVA
jgi:hypothetical protein